MTVDPAADANASANEPPRGTHRGQRRRGDRAKAGFALMLPLGVLLSIFASGSRQELAFGLVGAALMITGAAGFLGLTWRDEVRRGETTRMQFIFGAIGFFATLAGVGLTLAALTWHARGDDNVWLWAELGGGSFVIAVLARRLGPSDRPVGEENK